jgi:hypothetical protein
MQPDLIKQALSESDLKTLCARQKGLLAAVPDIILAVDLDVYSQHPDGIIRISFNGEGRKSLSNRARFED